MNFSPFTTQFSGIPTNAVNQFATAKFAQNITTANGQVVGVVSGGEGGVHYLRPVDNSAFAGQIQTNNQTTGQTNLQDQPQALITLPITMPGAKPGDAQQTVHIQVINPNPIQHHQQAQKFQMGQMQIPIQSFQPGGGTTVLTVAYSPQDGKLIPNHGFPEGMTVVAALQPQDLQLLAQAQAQQMSSISNHQQLQQNGGVGDDQQKSNTDNTITIKQEPDWDNTIVQNQADLSEYITQATQGLPVNLQPFLKFNPNVKCEPEILIDRMDDSEQDSQQQQQNDPLNISSDQQQEQQEPQQQQQDDSKPKRKRRTKKKPPKPKAPKPGQVLIATAIDGTTLFCCPECQMAYPEKENLEQHLMVHKIERRYICDICGAGLKRKEHLERHKSGHNPDRPYICSVCEKGFKRKEHLNLHFVIHSGEKNEICGECGKGFYRKDHLRKHAKSHAAKRLKEEMTLRAGLSSVGGGSVTNNVGTGGIKQIKIENSDSNNIDLQIQSQQQQQQIDNDVQQNQLNTNLISGNAAVGSVTVNNPISTVSDTTAAIFNTNSVSQTSTQPAISLSTVYVPTSDNTTLPVQIQIPQIVTTSCADGTTTSTLVMPTTTSSSSSSSSMTTESQQQSVQQQQQSIMMVTQ